MPSFVYFFTFFMPKKRRRMGASRGGVRTRIIFMALSSENVVHSHFMPRPPLLCRVSGRCLCFRL